MKRKQLGVSLSGLLIVSVFLAVLALLGMKLFPPVVEYFQIIKTVKAVAGDPSASTSVTEVRRSFERRASVDDISSVGAQDIEVSKEGSDVVISFAYEKRIPLFSNVSLLIDFQGSSKQ